MTQGSIPRQWASNTTFSGGAHAGEDTKVDPGSAIAANGFYPDLGFAAEHVNHQWSSMSKADRRAMLVAALHVTPLPLIDATLSDLQESMGACLIDVSFYQASPVVLIKTGSQGVSFGYDNLVLGSGGTLVGTGAAAPIRAAVGNGSRLVAIGDGANGNFYSDDGGFTWSAGVAGLVSADFEYLLYSAAYGGFFVAGGGEAAVYRTTDPDSVFWSGVGAGFAECHAIALLASGTLIALGVSGIEPRFSRSTDNGASFTGSVSPPDAATAEEPGDLAGCAQVSGSGALVYHVMRCNAGARLRVNVSADGITWTQTAIIEAPAGASFNARPRLQACQSTGLLVIYAPHAGGAALYTSMDGIDWLGPLLVQMPASALKVAAGRIFAAQDDGYFASAGIG